MTRKHPKQKTPITPITNAELQVARKTTNREVLAEYLHLLKHNVAPGLGCMQNEHLLALQLNPSRQQTPVWQAAAAVDNLWDYANAVVQIRLSHTFTKLEWHDV